MRPGAPLTAAAKTEKVNRTTLTRLVRGGVAAEQAGVGDVLDVMQPGIERGGVVPGLADGGADRGRCHR